MAYPDKDNVPQDMICIIPLEPISCQGNVTVQIYKKKTNFYYMELLKIFCKPVEFIYWNNIIHDGPHITQVVKNKVTEIKENNIAEFNYKLMHGVVACGRMLS